jgi:hypothetical protein
MAAPRPPMMVRGRSILQWGDDRSLLNVTRGELLLGAAEAQFEFKLVGHRDSVRSTLGN